MKVEEIFRFLALACCVDTLLSCTHKCSTRSNFRKKCCLRNTRNFAFSENAYLKYVLDEKKPRR
jgi:hypothetical protein